MSTTESTDEEYYEEDDITYTVTIHVTTEYVVERIEAKSVKKATAIALKAVKDDYGWTTKENISTQVEFVEEDF